MFSLIVKVAHAHNLRGKWDIRGFHSTPILQMGKWRLKEIEWHAEVTH